MWTKFILMANMLQCKEDIFFWFRYDFKNLQKCSVFKKRNQQYQFKSLELTLIVHVYIASIFCFFIRFTVLFCGSIWYSFIWYCIVSDKSMKAVVELTRLTFLPFYLSCKLKYLGWKWYFSYWRIGSKAAEHFNE